METEWIQCLNEAAAFHVAHPWSKLARSPRRIARARWVAWRGRRGDATFPARARLFWGDEMGVVLPDPVSAMLYCYGHYEPELSGFLLRFLVRGSVAIDVGAHVGYHALLISRLVGDNGTVHVFEPTPRTFALLRANLGGRGNVRLNQAAVWNDDTTLELSDFGSGLATFNTVTEGRLEDRASREIRRTRFRVPAVTLDRYLESYGGRVDFLKIDAENAEAQVLEGATSLLASGRPVVSLEVGDLGLGGAGRTREILSRVEARGYTIVDHDRGGVTAHRIRDHYTHGNVLLLPTERSEEMMQHFPPQPDSPGATRRT